MRFPLTEEQRESIRKGLLRYYQTAQGQKRIEQLRVQVPWNKGTGRPKPEPRIIKAVLQYNKNMVFIRQWPSITVASRRLGIILQGIWYCCNLYRKSAGGFVWRYN